MEKIAFEFAPSAPEYALSGYEIVGPDGARRIFNVQLTGGSYSVAATFDVLRQAGATAREKLRRAAAERWDVALSECRAEAGAIHHGSGIRLDYGALASDAAGIELEHDIALKPRAAWRVIGRSVARHDLPGKVTGESRFGIDTRPDGALVATMLHCPVFGGRLLSLDPAPALVQPGVRHVVRIESGVAVVAESFWQALQGARALSPAWDPGPNGANDTATIDRRLDAALELSGAIALELGDPASHPVELDAVYAVPFLAHMTMEPMNAAAHVHDAGIEITMPTQGPGPVQILVAQANGLPVEAVTVRPTLLGGGFGRRSEVDVAFEAVAISRAIKGPVHLIWSREADIQRGFPGAAAKLRLRAGVDAEGLLTALDIKTATPSILGRFFPPAVAGPVDRTMVHGLVDQAYEIPHLRMAAVDTDLGIPAGFWRSVGHRANAFAFESMINELAHRAGLDALDYRERLLAPDAHSPRRVLRRLRDVSGWLSPLLPGRSRGVALIRANNSTIGQVFEISMDFEDVIVHRATCVIDCGPVVNPDIVRAQMEGSIVDGINMAFHGGLTVSDGAIEQSQLHDFEWIGMDQVPEIDIHLIEVQETIGGVGEPGLPPVAPALAHAIFNATGQVLRTLPFTEHGIRLGTRV